MKLPKHKGGVVGVILAALLVAGACRAPSAAAQAPYNWTGLYLGAFAGAAVSGHETARAAEEINGLGPYNARETWRYDLGSSFIGGGQVGFNYQISSIVLGLENEVGYVRLHDPGTQPSSPAGDTVSRTTVGNWYDVVAARAGVALNRWLIYGKAGAAFTEVSSRLLDKCVAAPCGGDTLDASGRRSVISWAAGGGAEYAITKNWTWKAEYLFIDGGKSYNVTGIGAGGLSFTSRHRLDGFHTIKLGVNYKF